MKLHELLMRVQSETQDQKGRFASPEEITSWLNEGQLDFVFESGILRKNGEVTLVLDQATYVLSTALATDAMYLFGARWDTWDIPIKNSKWMKANLGGNWDASDQTGSLIDYVVQDLDGFGTIRVHYIPDSNFDLTKKLTCFYVYTPTVMSQATGSSADDPDIPVWFHPALIEYAKYKFYEKDSSQRNVNMSQYHYVKYQDWVHQAVTWSGRGFAAVPHSNIQQRFG